MNGGRLDMSVMGTGLNMSGPDDQPRRSAEHGERGTILLSRILCEDEGEFWMRGNINGITPTEAF